MNDIEQIDQHLDELTAQRKLDAIARERAGHEQTIRDLQVALDDAADAGNLAEAKRAQAETVAAQGLIASCDRRAARLKVELIKEQKAARRKINDALIDEFQEALKTLPARANKIGKIVATLAAELEAFHAEAAPASLAAHKLIKQVEKPRRNDYYHLMPGARFEDGLLGNCLIDELCKSGIFEHLATPSFPKIQRQKLPPIGEVVEKRVAELTTNLNRVRSIIDEAIEQAGATSTGQPVARGQE